MSDREHLRQPSTPDLAAVAPASEPVRSKPGGGRGLPRSIEEMTPPSATTGAPTTARAGDALAPTDAAAIEPGERNWTSLLQGASKRGGGNAPRKRAPAPTKRVKPTDAEITSALRAMNQLSDKLSQLRDDDPMSDALYERLQDWETDRILTYRPDFDWKLWDELLGILRAGPLAIQSGEAAAAAKAAARAAEPSAAEKAAAPPAPKKDGRLLLDSVSDGDRLNKLDFGKQLRAAAFDVINEELSGIDRMGAGFQMEGLFDALAGHSAEDVEQILWTYCPQARGVQSAAAMVPLIAKNIRADLKEYKRTDKLPARAVALSQAAHEK